MEFSIRPPGVVLVREHYQMAKRLMDVVICLLLLPAVVMILAICCVLVWVCDPGPVFFAQERTGRGNKRIKVYKLRTMVTNAEELREKYLHLNELTLPDFKISNDPRVTSVGRILRKTSLDELPQIFNVLIGNMSLVGPRPSSFKASVCDLWQTERLEVLPGITGLAQISGRNSIDTHQKICLDIQYIQNRSLLMDLQILLKTPQVILGGCGAY